MTAVVPTAWHVCGTPTNIRDEAKLTAPEVVGLKRQYLRKP